MIAVTSLALAAAQAATPAAPAPATLQQRFDAANTAAAAGRCAEALPLLTALENDPRVRRNARATAAVAVRKGGCLLRSGQREAGEASIRRGLPVLEAAGSEFAIDIQEVRLAMGEAALARLDYPAAVVDLRAALALAEGIYRIRPLMALSRATMFDGDDAGVRHAEEALRIAIGAGGDVARKELATVRTQYARALLNAGRNADGYRELKTGLKEQGGLTLKVGVADISTRSDLAIAAKLAGDDDAARNYLAYTGAGRGDASFSAAAQMDLPSCGAESGLKPDDMAVVEYSIADDGHVIDAAPIYTRAGPLAAIAFARAVAGWSWEAAKVAKVPALFRHTARVEVRCTRAFDRPALTAPLAEEAGAWLSARGARISGEDGPGAVALPLQRAALARAQAAGDGAATIAALTALGDNRVVPEDERTAAWKQAVAAAASAPPALRAYLAIRQAEAGTAWQKPREYRAAIRALLADPAYAADPLIAATLRMLAAQRLYRLPPPPDAAALLDQVIAAPALPPRHPLKVGAMLQRADMLAEANDLPGARALFERTGLTEEQCALIEPKPVVRRSGASSSDYPMAAVRMGFEGWVRVEFDIAPSGTTVTPRAIAAYPPFVFNAAAQGILRDSRYTSSYRPSGSIACAANNQSIVFRLPD